ncbi:MAG: hypothetical protein ACLP1Q_09740 [Solirubrobacteraceae bacterium]
MTDLRIPRGFSPGGAVDTHVEQYLVDAGFVPGYPLFAVDSLKVLQLIHILSGDDPIASLPLLPLVARIPDGSPDGERRVTPMLVAEVRRVWVSATHRGGAHWFLRGQLDGPEGARWYLDRIPVEIYVMRVFVKPHGEGYMQFVPQGSPKLGPICEGMPWASSPTRIPPPQ